MTDHKLTDDEIIHSLKVCSNDGDCSECKINPHKGNYGYCTSLAIKAALDLINRQKKEIENLQSEVEILQQWVESAPYTLEQITESIKIEAIKEFAQRLREIARMPLGTLYGTMVYLKDIDTLVKEMTGEAAP